MPGDLYLKDQKTVEDWKFGLTTVAWRKEDLHKRLERSKKLASFEEEVELKTSGEEGILLIRALCGLDRVVSNVNIPNWAGQIANLPKDALVETNALFERDQVRPVLAGELPDKVLELVMPHVENHTDILNAALTYDKELVVKAFLNDPLVKGRASEEEVRFLVNDMIANTKKYLPKGWE
jgi:alpha-galactosidase